MTRREWMTLGGLAIVTACGRKKGTGYPGYALIAAAGEDSVSVVDLTAFRLLNPIPVGASPAAVVPGGPDGRTYVLTPSNGSVHVVDSRLRVVSSRKLSDEVSQIRLSPNGTRLLALSASSQQLIEAEAGSLRVVKRYQLSGAPAGFDVAPDSYAAVSIRDRGVVDLFRLHTGACSHVQLLGRIGDLRFRADGERLLVANLHDQGLTALTVPRLEVIVDLPLAMQPENLCFNSDAGQLFVTGAGMDGVAIVFPYNPLVVEQTVLAGRDPGVMACSAQPAFLFVGSNSGSDVCIVRIDTRKMVGLVDVGQRPTYITTTPDSQYALILSESAGMMAVIRIPAIRVDWRAFAGKSGASIFTMLPVGSRPVHTAVVPWNV